jgi:LuxR family maltose regulon positive regulatory protein
VSVPLLATKFYIPPARPDAISRPRLVDKLLTIVSRPHRFGLLSGPAGFGKTTLLSEFAAALTQPVAWVSLDEGDNDPIRFWTYLIAAIQTFQAGLGEAALTVFRSPQAVPEETVATVLINELVRIGREMVLVLDDYHSIQNPSVHASVAFLLDHLPDRFHIILSSRVDPPWPLARFRARDQLVEVRAGDLRFTAGEAATFLNRLMGLNLSQEDVTALEERTEGWVAGLQLAALSMKGRDDIPGFIKAFTGSHVYVAEYLVEEVLRCQPEDVQAFLLHTSILERLNAELCDAVTGGRDGQSMLLALSRANLFIIPLDDEARWFRYHHLFADLLQARLRQLLPAEEIALLHTRAGIWYEQAGMIPEAIGHTLVAEDYPHAVQLIENVALPMILTAHFKTVEDWLQAVPPEYLRQNARVNMAFAWMHLMRRNNAQAAPHLERLQEIFSSMKQEEIEPTLLGEWLALQSMLLNAQGKARESCQLAEQALKLLPEDETHVRSMTYLGMADAYQQMLDYDRAEEACEMIIQQGRQGGDIASEMFGLSYLGLMLLQQGKLHSAGDTAIGALQRIERTGAFSPFSATFYGELAQVYYHWHQLEKARACFLSSVELSTLGGFSDAEIYHYVFLSRLFQMEGDLPTSLQEIEKALDRMQTAAPALVNEEVICQKVSIDLAVDHLDEAQAALALYGFAFEDGFSYPELASGASLPYALGLLYDSALRILLYRATARQEQQAPRFGIELAGLVFEGSLRCRHLPIALKTLLLRGQMQAAQGNEQAALADFVEALELGEPEGFISIFVEEGLPVFAALTRLMESTLLDSVQSGYVQDILGAFPKTLRTEVPRGAPPAPSPWIARDAASGDESLAPVESLTPRELEVLQLIALGDSNRVIAEKLVITVSAVKKHTGNIYGKLGVNSRTQAVARARQLGLLSTNE